MQIKEKALIRDRTSEIVEDTLAQSHKRAKR